ncbi:SPRY domain-containing protein 7-like [Centruroides sculpturatus]|uniref:SPRY domain-containing protein 7-like n=1 Tax=Centruroides sculpturatus TaxID=218467 RepID=UPI000C6D8E34|nr:SPRY domain-containing protein 7-like [Centruroides sculpturatus]
MSGVQMCKNMFCRCFSGSNGVGDYVSMNDQPLVVLDTSKMGLDVVIVKNGHRLCGTGAALANAPIVQNKAYFETKLQQSGLEELYFLGHFFRVRRFFLEEKMIGLSYDHVELNFYLNGKNMETPLTSAKGELYPVLYVDDGAILDAVFSLFFYPPPPGYDRILIEKSLL